MKAKQNEFRYRVAESLQKKPPAYYQKKLDKAGFQTKQSPPPQPKDETVTPRRPSTTKPKTSTGSSIKKTRSRADPNGNPQQDEIKYTVSYAESLQQMSKNLSVYGTLTELKLKERQELDAQIKQMKLAIKHTQEVALQAEKKEQDFRRELAKVSKVHKRKTEENLYMLKEIQEIKELLPQLT